MNEQAFAIIFTTLFVSALIFFVARELILWYFRINQIVNRMDTMIQHLEAINEVLQPHAPPKPIDTIPTVTRPPIEPGIKPKLRW